MTPASHYERAQRTDDGAGHTPGPWRLNAETREIVDPVAGRTICRAHLDSNRREYAETIANARLIAAAPELLKALEAVQKTMDGYRSQMKFCDVDALGYFREFDRRIEESGFRSAIAKAREVAK